LIKFIRVGGATNNPYGRRCRNKASLGAAGRDHRVVIFDHGAIHTKNLDLQADGSWLRDPKEDKSPSLKKQ